MRHKLIAKWVMDPEQDLRRPMLTITVASEREKAEVLEALRHLHDADIDTDIPMVNRLVHLTADDIEVFPPPLC